MSLAQITSILDEIDLEYKARKPTILEHAKFKRMQIISLVFLPASIAFIFKDFIGYMGSATDKKQAFNLSVKQRYNHLARIGVAKGMKREGYQFQEESSLSKQNAEPFDSLHSALSIGKQP